jgi:hydroxyquinol 1,2-dioxygenase
LSFVNYNYIINILGYSNPKSFVRSLRLRLQADSDFFEKSGIKTSKTQHKSTRKIMKNITIDNITEAVINHGDGGKTHPRLYQIYASLIKYLHNFAREVNLTEAELSIGRDFISKVARPTAQMPDGEIFMLTDVLGISELVDLLHHNHDGTVTESSLEGPMYVADAPELKMGQSIGIDEDGDTLFISGCILDSNGNPIDNALIEVWQTNSKGLYDIQNPNQPKGNFRGKFRTHADGKYAFETVVPMSYDVPGNGPTGAMLRLLGRHTRRPAHIHFKLSATDFTSLTTQLYPDDDPYLDSDTSFAVMSSTIMKLQKHDVSDGKKPFYTSEFNFILSSAVEEIEAKQNTNQNLNAA